VPSHDQQLNSIRAFREAVSQPLLLCGCCTRELFADEGIRPYSLRCSAMHNALQLLQNGNANFAAPSRRFPGLLFDDDSIDAKKQTVTLCSPCHAALTRNQLPALSLANGLWFGPPLGKDEFDVEDMRLPEELLASPNIGKLCVLTLLEVAGPGTGYRAYKGHTIVFPQQTLAITQKLPRVYDALSDCLQVVFVGSKLPARDDPRLQKVLSVRGSVVARFLLWQKRTNPWFKDIDVDGKALEALLEQKADEAVPENVYKAIKVVPPRDSLAEDHGPNPDAAVQQPEMFSTSAVFDVEANAVSNADQASAALRGASTDEDAQILIVPRGRDPVNTFGNPSWWYLTFPRIFYRGIGAPMTEPDRVSHLSLRKWAAWAMRIRDTRVRRHPIIFFLHNLIQRIALCASARLMVQLPSFRATAEQMQALNSQNVSPPVDCCIQFPFGWHDRWLALYSKCSNNWQTASPPLRQMEPYLWLPMLKPFVSVCNCSVGGWQGRTLIAYISAVSVSRW
jgi:hypothetical protein